MKCESCAGTGRTLTRINGDGNPYKVAAYRVPVDPWEDPPTSRKTRWVDGARICATCGGSGVATAGQERRNG